MEGGPAVGGPTNCPAVERGPTVRGGCTAVAGGPVDYAVDGPAELLPDSPADCAVDGPDCAADDPT